LRLTKGWKIGIVGLIVAFIGWSLQMAYILGKWGSGYNFLLATVWFVGMTIVYYGIRVKQREKKNLDNR
jgi:hypothetical protein